MMMYAVAYGNAFDGMATFGPFLTRADAIDFIDADGDGDFLIFEIDSPSNESKRNVNDLLGNVADAMDAASKLLNASGGFTTNTAFGEGCLAMSAVLNGLAIKCRETDQKFQ